MLSRLTPLAMIPGFVVCGMLVQYSNANLEDAHASFRTEEIEAAKESIALSLMGQIQFTAQSLVWMKTLEYLHNGVAFRMPTHAEEERGFRAQNSVGTAGGLEHAEGVPMALNQELDWRGPVGELQRSIMPHMTKHSHSDPVELIPWYELALKLNPNVERLYSMGAFFMADFAKQPKRALKLLRAGVRANPWSYEVRGALGRLLFEYHPQLGIDPQSAYAEAATILREAVDFAKEDKERLERNKEHFDDYQKQIFRESYLFLAKSLTELGRYEEALGACQEGFEVTGHNHLNVQKRIITRRMNGETEAAGEPETGRPAAQNETPANTGGDVISRQQNRQEESSLGQQPISITLGIAPPETPVPAEESPVLRRLLSDIHDHPYESLALRATRLNTDRAALSQAAQELCALRFAELETGAAEELSAEGAKHCLTPIGLYVYQGQYGFDFWRRMAAEAEDSQRRGIPVDLAADALRVSEEINR